MQMQARLLWFNLKPETLLPSHPVDAHSFHWKVAILYYLNYLLLFTPVASRRKNSCAIKKMRLPEGRSRWRWNSSTGSERVVLQGRKCRCIMSPQNFYYQRILKSILWWAGQEKLACESVNVEFGDASLNKEPWLTCKGGEKACFDPGIVTCTGDFLEVHFVNVDDGSGCLRDLTVCRPFQLLWYMCVWRCWRNGMLFLVPTL
jgi:hypothetical protein